MINVYQKDVIIIGGGPAGLAAAIRLREHGIKNILVLERERHLGGILRQCIHDGFGLTRFGESLSGPEYAQWFIDKTNDLEIETKTESTVVNITPEKRVTAISRSGVSIYEAKAVVLAMGCRERTRGALGIAGFRPAGVYNAGVAQSYINLHNTMIGREIIVLGSGDIGMIMARRLSLEGAHVKAVFEILPYPSGLPRNIEQCLNDYDIPLYLSHTVTRIHGKHRVEGVTISAVDESLKPIPGSENYYPCDTLVLSVGLIPENELSLLAGIELDRKTQGAFVDDRFQTSCPGIFAAGNVLHVHDLVDYVSIEAEDLADAAAEYLTKTDRQEADISIIPGENIGHVIPQKISGKRNFKLSLRVRRPLKDCEILLNQGGKTMIKKKFLKAIPAEMIQFQIPAANIHGCEKIEVTVNE
jgi:NADPH-dependent 2,4-dienoyl-CoA reductase/sulfur reductase-like enzyme